MTVTRAAFTTHTPAQIAQVLDAVRGCPDRGSVLPHTEQPECGCAERTECRAGRGRSGGGAVTLEDCVRCRALVLGMG
jgi:hypothetical protein